ncbi:MAG: radical SAM protein [Nitrospinales bacterium]
MSKNSTLIEESIRNKHTLSMASIRKKIQLTRGLFNGQVAKTGPFVVTWDIVGRCNLRCIGCPYHTPLKSHNPSAQDFPFEVFKRLCDELKELDTCSLVFQGSGEPFLHPDLFRMIQTAKSNGFEVVLLTNGTFLNRDMCKRLLESGLDTLKVSLWATSPREFEQNYPGTPRHVFTRIMDGLRTLSDLKEIQGASVPETILYFVINRNNYDSVNSAVDLALNTRCDGLYFSIMHNSSGTVDSLMLDEDEIRRLDDDLKQIEKRLNLLHLKHNIGAIRFRYQIGELVLNRIPCYIYWFHVRIRLDGHVFPCIRCAPEMDFGNVQTQSFKEIWNGKAGRAFRQLTMKRHADSEITEICDCRYCCFLFDNMRVHRIFRYFRPFVQKA